jgi:hypothetical protein
MCNKTQKLISSIHSSLIPKSAKATLKEMACHGDWHFGTGIRRSIARLAEDIGCSQRTISRDKSFLKAVGLLIRTRKHCKKIGMAEECRINLTLLDTYVARSKEIHKFYTQEKREARYEMIKKLAQEALPFEKDEELIHNSCGKNYGQPVDKVEINDRMAYKITDRMSALTLPIIHINTVVGKTVPVEIYESDKNEIPIENKIRNLDNLKHDPSKPINPIAFEALKVMWEGKRETIKFKEAERYLNYILYEGNRLAA